jgi:hypothetical protein
MQQSACRWLDVRAHAAGFSRNANQSAKLLAQHRDGECVVALSPVRPGATNPLSIGLTRVTDAALNVPVPQGRRRVGHVLPDALLSDRPLHTASSMG